jgi:hypothetical protein
MATNNVSPAGTLFEWLPRDIIDLLQLFIIRGPGPVPPPRPLKGWMWKPCYWCSDCQRVCDNSIIPRYIDGQYSGFSKCMHWLQTSRRFLCVNTRDCERYQYQVKVKELTGIGDINYGYKLKSAEEYRREELKRIEQRKRMAEELKALAADTEMDRDERIFKAYRLMSADDEYDRL